MPSPLKPTAAQAWLEQSLVARRAILDLYDGGEACNEVDPLEAQPYWFRRSWTHSFDMAQKMLRDKETHDPIP